MTQSTSLLASSSCPLPIKLSPSPQEILSKTNKVEAASQTASPKMWEMQFPAASNQLLETTDQALARTKSRETRPPSDHSGCKVPRVIRNSQMPLMMGIPMATRTLIRRQTTSQLHWLAHLQVEGAIMIMEVCQTIQIIKAQSSLTTFKTRQKTLLTRPPLVNRKVILVFRKLNV